MEKYINKSAVVAEIESYRNSFCDRNGYLEDVETNGLAYDTLGELKDSIDTLEVKEVESDKERNEREHQYWESIQIYWNYVLRTIDNKRILPTFKGQLLHDFKNELHTMKQIVGLINHPEIPEALFDKLALVFATWGGFHFHPAKTETEDTEVD